MGPKGQEHFNGESNSKKKENFQLLGKKFKHNTIHTTNILTDYLLFAAYVCTIDQALFFFKSTTATSDGGRALVDKATLTALSNMMGDHTVY